MKQFELQQRLAQLEQQTHTALFSYRQAKVLFFDENEKTLYAALCRHTKNGIIQRVCKGVWLNPMSQFATNDTRLEELALLLRPEHYNYVSMETVLSQASVISQQMFAYLTVMTTGAGLTVKASFGTLELVHTKRKWQNIQLSNVPSGHKMPWADAATAYRDLKRVGRNVDMVDEQELQQYLAQKLERDNV